LNFRKDEIVLRPVFLAAALCALTACGYVSPMTVAHLNALSPLEADPADIAVALTLPEGIGLAEEGAVFSVEASRKDTGEALSYRAKLAEESRGDIRILRIPKADHATLRDAQATVTAWKAERPSRGSGSFSVEATFCKTDPEIDPDATFSIAIQTEAGGAFLPLVSNAPLRRTPHIKDAIGTIEPC
jgi:hypothetical protein